MNSLTPESIARRKIKSRWNSIKSTFKKYAAAPTDSAREMLKGFLDRNVDSYRRNCEKLAAMPHRADKEDDRNFVQPAEQAKVAIDRLEKFFTDNKIQA